MQPKIIELKQAPVVLVELLEGAKEAHLDIRTGRICWSTLIEATKGGRTWHYLSSDYIGAKAVGILSDLTEEQFAECVDWYDYSHDGDLTALYAFKDYVNGIEEADDYWDEYPFDAAKDSFYSLLESENVYTENLLEKAAESIGHGTLDNFDQDYEEAQSRTIDPKRTVVLVKKEGATVKYNYSCV